jgi:polyvinyl alcohol dehydrogenase (cytochrome)
MTCLTWRSAALGVVGGVASLLLVAPALRAEPPTAGQQVWVQRCQGCHEPAVGHAPDRAALATRPRQAIEDSLTGGVMKAMATGLSAADIRAVADYIISTPAPAAAPPRAAASPPAITSQASPNETGMCARNPPIRTGPSDWSSVGLDERSTRFQPRPGLRAADVPRLKLKWAFALSGGGQPTVIGDWLFITNRDGKFYALDARTGCIRWVVSGASSRTTPMVVRSSISPSGWATFIGEPLTTVAAYDAENGKLIWKSPRLEAHPFAVLTGSPAVWGERIYVPISSFEEAVAARPTYACCTFRGSLVALDLKTGKPLWQTYVIDEPLTPGRRNSAGTQLQGPAGAAIWSAPTIDAKRGLVYVATGDSYTELPTTGADALVAMDMTTGKVRWKTEVTAGDNYNVACDMPGGGPSCPNPKGGDFDFGSPPILHGLPGGKQVLLAGQKSALTYGLDPDTGKILWTMRVGTGSALGGIEWGMASDDRRLFAANADFVPLLLAGLRDAHKIPPTVPVPRANPGLSALDPATGKILWQTPAPEADCHYRGDRSHDFLPGVCFRAQSAAPAAMPGVVFSGTLDGWFRAYDAASGKILWAYSTTAQTYDTVNGVKDQPGGGIDGMGPAIADGMVYQVSGFKGSSNTGGNAVNVLLAFSVDGK